MQDRLRLNRQNRTALWGLTIILFGALAFRVWRLGTQSLWHDEAWSVFSAYQPLTPLDPNYPPFFTVLLGIWIRLVGDSVWAMRYWSALIGVITVAAGALIARRWFGSRAAMTTALLLAFSPPLWVFSQEIRSYVAMPLLTLILLGFADAVLHPKNRTSSRIFFWVLLVELIALYVHNLSVPLVAWLNVTVIAVLLLRRDWARAATWIAGQIVAFILYLPWLLTQRPTGTALNTPPALGLALFGDIWQSYFTGIKALVGADPLLTSLIAVFGVVTVICVIWAVVRCRSLRTLLVLSQVILLPIFELIIILAAHIDFHPRYFLLGVPATLMLVAVGATTPPLTPALSPTQAEGKGARRGATTGYRWKITLATSLMLGVLTVAIAVRLAGVLFSSAGYQHDDFRAIAERYAQLGPDDAIIIPYGWEPTLDYYSRKMNFQAKFINIPLHADARTIITRLRSELEGVRRAELFTWYQLPADLRGAYPCLVRTNRVLQESLTYSGVKTDGYVAAISDTSMPATDIFDKVVSFGTDNSSAVQMVGMQSWSGTEGACVITRWQLGLRTPENWSIAVRVLNPLGWEIARTDSALLNDQQAPTSLWAKDSIETAFSALKLPEGTVIQGNYPVAFTLYSPQSPRGLDVLHNGQVLGKDVIVGSVTRFLGPAVKPSSEDIAAGDNLYLHRADKPNGPFQPGQEIRLTLEWWRTQWGKDPDQVSVSLEGQGWRVESTGTLFPAPKVLTWHSLVIPATASGHATLRVTVPGGKSVELGGYGIAAVTHTFIQPTIAHTEHATFGDMAELVGVNGPGSIVSSQPFKVKLIWKAGKTPPKAYTVFIHLLNSNGQVIAQSDSQPAGGMRPTTGWVPGEYISDEHELTFNKTNYHGPATVEAGLYDALTQKRVSLGDGSDHVVLSLAIDVK